MKKLYMQFKNARGYRKTIIVEYCHQHLTPEVVRQAMEQIIELQLFERDGVQLCTEIVGAKYVEKRETLLFDDDNPSPTSTSKAAKEINVAGILTESECEIAGEEEIISNVYFTQNKPNYSLDLCKMLLSLIIFKLSLPALIEQLVLKFFWRPQLE